MGYGSLAISYASKGCQGEGVTRISRKARIEVEAVGTARARTRGMGLLRNAKKDDGVPAILKAGVRTASGYQLPSEVSSDPNLPIKRRNKGESCIIGEANTQHTRMRRGEGISARLLAIILEMISLSEIALLTNG